jgi:hypothetical protein
MLQVLQRNVACNEECNIGIGSKIIFPEVVSVVSKSSNSFPVNILRLAGLLAIDHGS